MRDVRPVLERCRRPVEAPRSAYPSPLEPREGYRDCPKFGLESPTARSSDRVNPWRGSGVFLDIGALGHRSDNLIVLGNRYRVALNDGRGFSH